MSLDSAYAARPLPYFYSIPSEPHTGVHEHVWVSPFSSAPCLPNVHALSDSNPQPPFLIIKKGPKWDPSSNSYWRRAGDSNPRCPFGAYSLSRRAPSASRSALRNSRSIVTKQSKLGKREFSNCPVAFPPCSFRYHPSERLREPSSSLPMVRHIWKMQPRARKKKPLSTSCTAASAS